MESLINGPKATVTVLESPSFQRPSATILPGTQQLQLRRGLKLMQSIDSLKIDCKQ